MMLTRLTDRLDRMRRSVLTIWISAFVVGMVGWGVAAVLAAVVFRAVGGRGRARLTDFGYQLVEAFPLVFGLKIK